MSEAICAICGPIGGSTVDDLETHIAGESHLTMLRLNAELDAAIFWPRNLYAAVDPPEEPPSV